MMSSIEYSIACCIVAATAESSRPMPTAASRNSSKPTYSVVYEPANGIRNQSWATSSTPVACTTPISMDGSEGPRCQSTRQFALNLMKLRDIPLIYWDERLSTAAVTRTLLEADASRKRRAEVVDKMAAAYILQGVLDAARPLS